MNSNIDKIIYVHDSITAQDYTDQISIDMPLLSHISNSSSQNALRQMKAANMQLMNVLENAASNDAARNGLVGISVKLAGLSRSMEASFSEIKAACAQYTQVLSQIPDVSLSDTLREQFADLQMKTLTLLGSYASTPMLDEVHKLTIDMNYEGMRQSIAQAVEEDDLRAPDVAFLKSSEMAKLMQPAAEYHGKLEKMLQGIRQWSIIPLSQESNIEFSIARNQFLYGNGYANTEEVNAISSGIQAFVSQGKELFKAEELFDFMNYLFDRPMCGLEHQIGKRIAEYLEYLKETKEKTIDLDRERFFHARIRNKNSAPYLLHQMMEAPEGIPGTGRYNHVGRSHYYFSDQLEGARNEVKKHCKHDETVQIAILKPGANAKLLDLSGTLPSGKKFLEYIRYDADDTDRNKMPRVYLIPGFVSDCCKRLGFDGIKYYGTKKYCNYVMWDASKLDYVESIIEYD